MLSLYDGRIHTRVAGTRSATYQSILIETIFTHEKMTKPAAEWIPLEINVTKCAGKWSTCFTLAEWMSIEASRRRNEKCLVKSVLHHPIVVDLKLQIALFFI